jgi:hypothetical protein
MAQRDPTAGFTDMQWFMYHQRNVAWFAAFTDTALTDADLLHTARTLVELAPQLEFGFPDGIPDGVLTRAIYKENVASLDGLPDRWLDRGDSVFDAPPLFRLRYASLAAPDAGGRAGFLLVQVVHALVEGADSALLSRSQSAAHPVSTSRHRTAPLVKAAAVGLGAVLAGLHLIAGNVATAHPGPFRAVTRAYPRRLFSTLARQHGVRQRALLFALVLGALFESGTANGKRRISSTYSSIDDGGGADRDAFMRMRMRFAVFDNAKSFPDFVRALDRRLAEAEAKESGFNAELNARGIRTHRRLSRLIPFAYRPRVFQFMPYDMVLALVPPHRLGGRLTAHLREPVYAGAALEGANACVIVPNRQVVTFNFYIQDKLAPRLARLDTELAPLLISRSETVG